jgi:hypothetical protein
MGTDFCDGQRGATAVIADSKTYLYRHRNPSQGCPLTAGHDLEGRAGQASERDMQGNSLNHPGKRKASFGGALE